MRKILFLFLVSAFTANGMWASAVKEDNSVITDSVGFCKKDKLAECFIMADVPVQGNGLLCNTIREFISEQFGGTYDKGYAAMDSLVAYYGNMQFAELHNMADGLEQSDMAGFPYSYYATVRKIYETDKVVTYQTVISQYWGGAHPSTYASAMTFRKSDGRRFGDDIFNKTFSEKYVEIIKEGLKKYFDVKTDEELRACLLDSGEYYTIPMPQNPPYFTEDGIVLSYGQYEIAPYAAGMPAVVIPYGEAKALLKVSVIGSIE